MIIIIDVLGTPAPKGSSRAFVNKRTGRAILAPSGSDSAKKKIKNWNAVVSESATDVVGENRSAPPFVDRSLTVTITFRMTRPKGHWRTGRNAGFLRDTAPRFPQGKPDIDKLARTTLDCLTGIVFDDDSRIARLVLSKTYALEPGEEGARITIEELKV